MTTMAWDGTAYAGDFSEEEDEGQDSEEEEEEEDDATSGDRNISDVWENWVGPWVSTCH